MPASDKINYRVVSSYENHKEAAELLAKINVNIIVFLRRLKMSKNNTPQEQKVIENILTRYNYEAIYENDPLNIRGETSYAINKGQKIFLCLRRKSNPQVLIEYNTLIFVILHEIAHLGNDTWGHKRDFWQVFKFILTKATEFNIYIPVDYVRQPVIYCGLLINYQPLYDANLARL
ncbi:MAG: Wss1p-related putative metallopeptidase [Acidimicrobiales bacterium]